MKSIFLCCALLGSAYLLPAQPATPGVITILQAADSVGLYDKHELRLNIKSAFVNPFDPDEIDVQATFTSPSGKRWTIPGFYYYSFGSMWKVRFAPDELGVWKYSVSVRDKTGSNISEEKSFKAVRSKYKGPIRIAANHRYLEYDDGTPYFGVGLWYNGRVTKENLDELKTKGVNFISNFITPLEIGRAHV